MRERILEVATAMFVQKGYPGVAMREISEACGITKAALYYHFASKADLLYAIFTQYLDEIAAVVGKAVAGGGTNEDQIRRVVRGLFAQPAEQRSILRVAMHDLGNLDAQQRTDFRKEYFGRFMGPIQKIFSDGQADGEFRPVDPAFIAWLLLGMVYPFFGPAGGPAPATTDATVEGILEVLLVGVAVKA